MRYYYTNPQNEPVGPVESREMAQLAQQGIIDDETPAIVEGAETWSTWGRVRGARSAPRRGSPVVSDPGKYATVLGDGVAIVLRVLQRRLSPQLLRDTVRHAGHYGHFAIVLGAVLTVIAAIVQASREDSMAVFLVAGPGALLVLAVAQYSAMRFMSASAQLIASNPNRLASKSLLECAGLFLAIGALATMVSAVGACFATDSALPLVPGVIGSVVLLVVAAAALNPEELNVSSAPEATAGEEAISLMAFGGKVSLLLAPVMFMLLSLLGMLALLIGLFDHQDRLSYAAMSVMPMPAEFARFGGAAVLIVACLLPLFSYLVFLLTYLALDVVRAILSVPAKLDVLKKS